MGDNYLFLPADGSSADPPLYYRDEDDNPELERVGDSFWDWIEQEVEGWERHAAGAGGK